MSAKEIRLIVIGGIVFALLLAVSMTAAYHRTNESGEIQISPIETPPSYSVEDNKPKSSPQADSQPPEFPDTSAMSVLDMANRLHVEMQPSEVLHTLGEPSKIQQDLNDYVKEQTWYYRRYDGVLQIHFSPYSGLDTYHTY